MKNWLRNWKTSTVGIGMLLMLVPKLANPATLTIEDISAIAGGVGLVLAKDGDKSHAPNPLAAPTTAQP